MYTNCFYFFFVITLLHLLNAFRLFWIFENKQCRTHLRNLELEVDTHQLNNNHKIASALQSSKAAMDTARNYNLQTTTSNRAPVASYENAVRALKQELKKASEIIHRETTIATALQKAKERGMNQLNPILQKFKALVASTEVSGIRNQSNIAFVLNEAEDR